MAQHSCQVRGGGALRRARLSWPWAPRLSRKRSGNLSKAIWQLIKSNRARAAHRAESLRIFVRAEAQQNLAAQVQVYIQQDTDEESRASLHPTQPNDKAECRGRQGRRARAHTSRHSARLRSAATMRGVRPLRSICTRRRRARQRSGADVKPKLREDLRAPARSGLLGKELEESGCVLPARCRRAGRVRGGAAPGRGSRR